MVRGGPLPTVSMANLIRAYLHVFVRQNAAERGPFPQALASLASV